MATLPLRKKQTRATRPPADKSKQRLSREADASAVASRGQVLTLAEAADAKRVANEAQAACRSLGRALQDRYAKFGIAAGDAPRWKTAAALVDRLGAAAANDVLGVLASADVQTSETAMGKSLKSAAALVDCIAATSWSVFENIADLTSAAEAAKAIRDKVRQALQADEHAIPLATTLSDAQDDAVELLAKVAKERTEHKEEQQKPDRQTKLPQGERLVRKGQQSGLDAEAAQKLLAELQQQMATSKGRRLSIDWRITEVSVVRCQM